jgi:hypothetical protein
MRGDVKTSKYTHLERDRAQRENNGRVLIDAQTYRKGTRQEPNNQNSHKKQTNVSIAIRPMKIKECRRRSGLVSSQ